MRSSYRNSGIREEEEEEEVVLEGGENRRALDMVLIGRG